MHARALYTDTRFHAHALYTHSRYTRARVLDGHALFTHLLNTRARYTRTRIVRTRVVHVHAFFRHEFSTPRTRKRGNEEVTLMHTPGTKNAHSRMPDFSKSCSCERRLNEQTICNHMHYVVTCFYHVPSVTQTTMKTSGTERVLKNWCFVLFRS